MSKFKRQVALISVVILALFLPSVSVAEVGDLYALIVGISKYKNPKIRQLNLSDKDARDFAEFLRNQNQLFRKNDVTLLCNEQATKAEIEKNLNHKLRQAGKDDTVVVFFSGHGSDDPATPGEFFFVTYDADPSYLTATAVNMNQNRVLNRLDSKRVVLIADACYAGNFTSMGTKSLRPALENFVRDFNESRGRVFLTSSRPDELSMEKPGLRNSVFTHYLLKGLSGEADKDGDGIVGIKELYDYVYEKTRKETNHLQHPQWEARLEGSFPISVGRARPESMASGERLSPRPAAAAAKIRGVTDSEILIGQWGPQTGPAAILGAMARGTGAYFDMVNDEGGINGRKIKYLLRDDAYQPSKTKAVADELVEKEGIFAVVGGAGTPTGMAVRDYLVKKKIPWVGPATGSEAWTHPLQEYIFAVYPRHSDEAFLLTQYCVEKMGKTNIVFFYQNDDFGKEGLNGARKYMKQKRLSLAAEVPVELSETDLKSQATRIKKANADAVIMWVLPKHAATILGQTKTEGFQTQWIANSMLSDSHVMYRVTESALRN